jgi:hypothetical protein
MAAGKQREKRTRFLISTLRTCTPSDQHIPQLPNTAISWRPSFQHMSFLRGAGHSRSKPEQPHPELGLMSKPLMVHMQKEYMEVRSLPGAGFHTCNPSYLKQDLISKIPTIKKGWWPQYHQKKKKKSLFFK